MPLGVMKLYYAAVKHKVTGQLVIKSDNGLDKKAAERKATALLREIKMMKSKEAHKNYKKVVFRRYCVRVRPGIWEEASTEEEMEVR